MLGILVTYSILGLICGFLSIWVTAIIKRNIPEDKAKVTEEKNIAKKQEEK